MKQIVLCPNPKRDHDIKFTLEVKKRLEECGYTPSVCPLFYSFPKPEKPLWKTELEEALETADILICFGGDGTILHLARSAAKKSIPILTVNMGNKGFIAELERKDIDRIIQVAVSEEYTIDYRMMLDVSVTRGGERVFLDFALNDAVVAAIARIIDISVYGDGKKISKFSGDGIIVATPTGSTAYSMAAGGPIVEPIAENIIVTPICAHALIAKSFVLAPERRVTVEVSNMNGKQAYMSVDGGSFDLLPGDIISISKSEYVTRLIKASNKSFYEIVNEKLGGA